MLRETDMLVISHALRVWKRDDLVLENRTELPMETAAVLFEWSARFLSVKKAKVEIVQGRQPGGTANYYHASKDIVLRLPHKPKFPLPGHYPDFVGFPVYDLCDMREWLVAHYSHELAHLCGASGTRDGEFQCEITAAAALLNYRSHRRELVQREKRFKRQLQGAI